MHSKTHTFLHGLIFHTSRLAKITAAIFAFLVIIMLGISVAAHLFLLKFQAQLPDMIRGELSRTLGRQVQLGSISLIGLNRVEISPVAVAQPGSFARGTAFTAQKVVASVNPITLLRTRGQNPADAISRIEISTPTASVTRDAQGKLDCQDVIDRLRSMSKNNRTLHARIEVDGGSVTYSDKADPSSPRKISKLAGYVAPTGNGSMLFKLDGDAGQNVGAIRVAGDYSEYSSATRLNVDADSLSASLLAQFLPENSPFIAIDGSTRLKLSALLHDVPAPGKAQPADSLTAEVDLRGLEVKIRGAQTPVKIEQGSLRLAHDPKRFPRGSRLELVALKGEAGGIPLTAQGMLDDIDIFDAAHSTPKLDFRLGAKTSDGTRLNALLPAASWKDHVKLPGAVTISAHVTGTAAKPRIDGEANTAAIKMNDISGENLMVKFTLDPSAKGNGAHTLTANATARQAVMGSVHLDALRIVASSDTPLAQLADKPVFNATMNADSLDLPWASAKKMTTSLVTDANGVDVKSLRAELFGGAIQGAGYFPWVPSDSDAEPLLTAKLPYQSIDLAEIARRFGVAALKGKADGTLDLAIYPRGRVQISTEVKGTNVVLHDLNASTVTGMMKLESDTEKLSVKIPQASLVLKEGNFTITDGEYLLKDGGRVETGVINIPLHSEGIELAQFSDQLQGVATLDGVLTGQLDHPALAATLKAGEGKFQQYDFQSARAELFCQDKTLLVNKVAFEQPGMTILMDGAGQGFDPREAFKDVTLTLQLHGAPVNDVLAMLNKTSPWAIEGATEGEIRVVYKGATPNTSGEVAIPNAVIHIPHNGDYPLALDRVSANFDIQGDRMNILSLMGIRGGATVNAKGHIDFPAENQTSIELAFTSDNANIADIPLDLFDIPRVFTGSVTAQGKLSGALEENRDNPLRLEISAESADMQARNLALGATKLAFAYQPYQQLLDVSLASVDNPALHAEGAGHVDLTKQTLRDVNINVSRADIASTRKWLAEALPGIVPVQVDYITGQGQAALKAQGPWAKPDIDVNTTLTRLSVGGMNVPNIQAKGALTPARAGYKVRLDELIADDGRTVKNARVSGTIDDRGELNLRVNAPEIRLDSYAAQLGVRAGGTAAIDGTIGGSLRQPVADLQTHIAQPAWKTTRWHQFDGHINIGRDAITLADGKVWLSQNMEPATLRGRLPISWDGAQPSIAMSAPMSAYIQVPMQRLDGLRALLPAMPPFNGMIGGDVQIDGTPGSPYVRTGSIDVKGNISAPGIGASNVSMHMNLSGSPDETRVALENGFATLGGVKAGGISFGGDIVIPNRQMEDMDSWRWSVQAQFSSLSLPKQFMIPSVSGNVQLSSRPGEQPILTGVLLAEHARLKEPSGSLGAMSPSTSSFNPRLSLVLQIGSDVKLEKGIFRIPLRPTPAAATSVAMVNPGSSYEMGGSWGVITGTLNSPELYARFEVEGGKLSFPLNLFGSVRNAKGHVTYNITDGAKVVMGIPKTPRTAQR